MIGFGIILSLCLFAAMIQLTDANEYRLTHIDPATGLALYTPHSSFPTLGGCYENTVTINNLGFHGRDVAAVKAKDVFRIVIIGGSYVEARQVPVEDMFSTLLEDKLNGYPDRRYTYEIIPLGVNGNSPFLSVLYYKFYGSALKPDLVINFESQFELANEYPTPSVDESGLAILEVNVVVEDPTKALIKDVSRRSKLVVNLYNRYLMFRDATFKFLERPFFFMPQNETASSPAELSSKKAERWQAQQTIVGALAARVKEDKATLLMTSWYSPEVTITPEELSDNFDRIAAHIGAPYLDLSPAVTAAEAASGVSATFSSCDGHWSPAGHEYVADTLYRYLLSNPRLMSR